MNNDWWDYLRHSSKGSTWSNHKYIKKVGDKYIYADSPDKSSKDDKSAEESSDASKIKDNKNRSSDGFALDQMANKVIRGEFGNGEQRKQLLGRSYKEIQKRVNEVLKSSSSKTSVSKDKVKKGSDYAKKILNSKRANAK